MINAFVQEKKKEKFRSKWVVNKKAGHQESRLQFRPFIDDLHVQRHKGLITWNGTNTVGLKKIITNLYFLETFRWLINLLMTTPYSTHYFFLLLLRRRRRRRVNDVYKSCYVRGCIFARIHTQFPLSVC